MTVTLTIGRPKVVDVVTAEGVTTESVPATAALVEQGSDQPLAQAILRRAHGLTIPPQKGFENRGVGAARRSTANRSSGQLGISLNVKSLRRLNN